MFVRIQGMLVNLKDYIENKELQKQLENDEKFKADVVSNFDKEYLSANKKQSLDKLLENVVQQEIEKRIKL